MNDPADPRTLQNDGDPIREAALPREAVAPKPVDASESDATCLPRAASVTSQHEDHIERFGVFYIRWTRGPNYERAFLCIEDGEPDMNDFAEVSFGQAAKFKAGWLATQKLARRAVTPPGEADAHGVYDGDRLVVAYPDRKDAEEQVRQVPGGSIEPLFRGAAGYREGLLRASPQHENYCHPDPTGSIGWQHREDGADLWGKVYLPGEAQPIAGSYRPVFDRPQPDLTTPYTPRVVDYPDGHSEFMLEQGVPVFWVKHSATAEAYAQDDGRYMGASWPTREQSEATPEPVAWQWRGRLARDRGWISCTEKEARDAHESMEVRPLYAAPPAPVPAGEVADDDIRSRALGLIRKKGWKPGDRFHFPAMVGLLCEFGRMLDVEPAARCNYPACGCDADATCLEAFDRLTTAPPRADAGEVTEVMFLAAQREFNRADGWNRQQPQKMRAALRAALAAREPRS